MPWERQPCLRFLCEEDARQEIQRESSGGRNEVTPQVLRRDNSSFGSWMLIRVVMDFSVGRESRRRKADAFITLGTLAAPHKHPVSCQFSLVKCHYTTSREEETEAVQNP